ncbi:MAG: hypothetical protein WDO72_05920 [Pseudomonadota bacterium]
MISAPPGFSSQLGMLFVSLVVGIAAAGAAHVAARERCDEAASSNCYFSVSAGNGALHFYASRLSGSGGPQPVNALIAVHGHPRDANLTFNAALRSARSAAALERTVVIAPLFQVANERAARCKTAGVPAAQTGDLLWTCDSWADGAQADNRGRITSFAAMDALIADLVTRWPGLRTVTVAGFSAGAQLVQRYIGFAADSHNVAVRYVVADPGVWLYFDAQRAQPRLDGAPVGWERCDGGAGGLGRCELAWSAPENSCADFNRWRYGIEGLPAALGRDAAAARRHYADADIHYLEGALDTGESAAAIYKLLDKSCAAQLQGPYRLQRGLVFAEYDRHVLSPARQREVQIVPGCAHDVACVFSAPAARAALFVP